MYFIQVPKLPHEIQIDNLNEAIRKLVFGEIDYFNASAVPHDKRVNIFFARREIDNSCIVCTWDDDLINNYDVCDNVIDFDEVKTHAMRIINNYGDIYKIMNHGDRLRAFVYVGGKNR